VRGCQPDFAPVVGDVWAFTDCGVTHTDKSLSALAASSTSSAVQLLRSALLSIFTWTRTDHQTRGDKMSMRVPLQAKVATQYVSPALDRVRTKSSIGQSSLGQSQAHFRIHEVAVGGDQRARDRSCTIAIQVRKLSSTRPEPASSCTSAGVVLACGPTAKFDLRDPLQYVGPSDVPASCTDGLTLTPAQVIIVIASVGHLPCYFCRIWSKVEALRRAICQQ
jgi:hypothetical protein